MSWVGKDLNGKILRLALDTVYFTGSFSLGEEILDGAKVGLALNQITCSILKTVFQDLANVETLKHGVRIAELENTGIFFDLYKQFGEIKISAQFKGVFFARDDGLRTMQFLMISLMSDLEIFFRVTRIDVAQDITLRPGEVLPPSNESANLLGFKYDFKHSFQEHSVSVAKKKMKPTGYVFSNSRFKIRLYDKKEEMKNCRSEKKKQYYDAYFESLGSDTPVSRFELQIKQESCEPFLDCIFQKWPSEDLFCAEVLKKFGHKHKLRQRKVGSTDQSWKRQPVNSNWLALFRINEVTILPVQTAHEFRYSATAPSYEKLARYLADLSLCEGMRIEELLGKLSGPYHLPKLEAEARERKRVYEQTQERLEKARLRAVESFQGDQERLLLWGPDGVPITSPSRDNVSRGGLA